MSKEEALQELEALRGQVSDTRLNFIINRVKSNFDRGFGSPSVLVDIVNYPENRAEGDVSSIINVMLSFQGSVEITNFTKFIGESKWKVDSNFITPGIIDWMHSAKEKYKSSKKH